MIDPRAGVTARRRVFVATFLVLLSIGAALVALPSTGEAAPTTPMATRVLATPLWSGRRLPAAAIAIAQTARVAAAIDGTMPGWGGCVAVDESGHALATLRPSEPVVPASNMKLLTAFAAIRTLGADYRFVTRAVADAAPRNGSVSTLYIVGGGDPLITTAAYVDWRATQPELAGDASTTLSSLVDAIANAGVKHIGELIGDDRRYSNERNLGSWSPADRTSGDVGPLGALTVNSGYSSFHGTTRVPAGDPVALFLEQLRSLLTSRGITVGGTAGGTAAANATQPIGSMQSPPLAGIVAEMLRSSDNTTAELLVRELGAHATAAPGATTQAGTTAVLAALNRAGIPTVALTLLDGSGLSHGDRATCGALVGVLASSPPALFDALPVAGRSGTLVTSFLGTSVAGRLHAKTGTLAGVTALSGTFDSAAGPSMALVLNGSFGASAGVAQRDRVTIALTDALAPIVASSVVPLPLTPSA